MRALLIVLDSVGVGCAPDAAAYGDEGAHTLGHILERCPDLRLPTLRSLGLGRILGDAFNEPVTGCYGRMQERAAGKDSTTGHWELAGVTLREPLGVFERFPEELVGAIEKECGVRFLGNYPASGTEIIQELGEEHVRSGRPILYTSADSVLQIAAHEEVVTLDRLYAICQVARRHADPYRIGRVIARPFVGVPGRFTRTANRHDYSLRPPRTVLDAISESGHSVTAIGKVSDLFDGRGITESLPTKSNAGGMRQIEEVWESAGNSLVFATLVDFDTLFGHRRDPIGYARALAEFDQWLAHFLPRCQVDDLLIITADHGNDPTYRGTDHTREEVPLLVRQGKRSTDLGLRSTFADVAATLSEWFGIQEPWSGGRSFLNEN